MRLKLNVLWFEGGVDFGFFMDFLPFIKTLLTFQICFSQQMIGGNFQFSVEYCKV